MESRDNVHDVLVTEKSNTVLVFVLFSTEENFMSFHCCCFAKVLPFHFTESRMRRNIHRLPYGKKYL